MPKFYFAAGDLSDGPVSATAGVEADTLELAKAAVTDYLAEAEVQGAPPGVIPLCTDEGLQIHVRITPEAVADAANWESDDGEVEEPTKLEQPDDGFPDKEEYLQGAGYCPFCKSAQIEGDSLEVEGDAVYQDVRCLECEAQWQDEYHLKNARVLYPPSATPHADGVVRCTGCGDDVDRRSTCGECRQCTGCCSCNT